MSSISNNATTDSATSIGQIKYSYIQSYSYPVKVITYRLKQEYFVSDWTARDLRYD
jgi:hypothetical protein